MHRAVNNRDHISRLFCIFAWIAVALVPVRAAETDDLQRRFQARLDSFRQEYRFPGATAAYVLPDGATGVAASGLADVRRNSPMMPRTRMLAASIGKTFVGATIVALDGEGQLGLDEPVADWLGSRDWFKRLANHESITLRHLLTHTSGLPNHVYSEGFQAAVSDRWRSEKNPFPPEALVDFVLDQPPLFSAGQGWAYTDTGFILLGMVIESVTGENYYDVVRRRFVDPLKLFQTTPSNRTRLRDLATGYVSQDNPFGFPPETTTSPGVMAWNPGIEWTGGGFVSTSGDLARWGALLFQGHAMDAPYLADLLMAVPVDSTNPNVAYGLGVAIYRGGAFGTVYGHGGWIPGYSSSLRFYADHKVSIAFQINSDIATVDGSDMVLGELERILAETVIGTLDSTASGDQK